MVFLGLDAGVAAVLAAILTVSGPTVVLPLLAFIRRGQAAGLTLVEVASILDLRREGAAPCAHVQSLLVTKLHDVQERQRGLASLETELEQLLGRSHELDPADCTDWQICHIIAPRD